MARIVGLAILALASWAGTIAVAQSVTFNGQTVDLNSVPAEVRAKIQSGEIQLPPGAVMSGGRPGGEQPKPAGEAAPAADAGKKEEAAQPAEGGAATVKRGEGDGQADPKELKAATDKDGMVQFSFHGQPWADVLQWYADLAKASLDWQELPADKLNLTTQRRYSLPETRDLLNRHLIARGFAMLAQGELLTVVKIDKIDPSLVPRLDPDDLEDHMPHDFARVRFDLPESMDPAKAVEDVKVLLNPSAKVTPLLASKQLMVIDAVANLRDVRDLIYGEQLSESDDIRPEQFPIRYRRADYVADQIMIVLGLDPQSRKSPMELQLEQQRLQLLMQMQGSGKDVSQMLRQDGPPVFLAVDRRRNMISVNAPPKEMDIVKRVVKQFDVPEDGGMAMREELTTKRYRTASVSPDAIVTALKEIATLSPLTQFQSDSQSKTIFATATAADHETIQGMIDRLDGSGRELHVIWLSRRTPADQIAGTIKALMVGEPKQENNRRPYWYYDPWENQNNEPEDTGFRIQADVENNRLMVMATDDEFAEVTTMLEELGVITSDRGNNPATFRVLEARDPQSTAELIERLRSAWGGRNELNITVAPPAEKPAADPPPAQAPDQPAAAPAEEEESDEDTLTQRLRVLPNARQGRIWLAQYADDSAAIADSNEAAAETPAVAGAESPDPEATETPPAELGPETAIEPGPATDAETPTDAESPAAAPASAAPINLTVTPDGRIILSSSDPVALDQLEELLSELSPQRQDFKLYKLNNSDCRDVWYNLRDYFRDELASDEDDEWFNRWNGMQEGEDSATLGKRRKLRFIWDTATNSILAQNASPAQLETIDKLIEIYDQPVAEDAVRKRRTEIVQVKYSRANDIATALKEVFRDLLSSKDKEFQDREGNQRGSRREIFYRFPGTDNSKSSPVKMAFEGALSIGVDSISNTLIISAEDQIFDSIKQIVTTLDEQARPETVVQVHRISGSLDAEELENALETAISKPWLGDSPASAAGGGQEGGRGGDRGRGDRGGRGGGDGRRGRGDRDNDND